MMRRQSQALVGYLMLFVAIVAAIIVISHYVRNSFSGKLREVGDAFGGGEVYEPYGTQKTVVKPTF